MGYRISCTNFEITTSSVGRDFRFYNACVAGS